MTENQTNQVLIIDDSPEQIRYVSQILKPEGCRIYAATSGEEALKILERHLPNLILMDIVMPEMDGFTLCKIIKSDSRTADIPVIFATAYHDEEYIGRGFEAGGCDYVGKPFIRQELLERVKVRIKLSQKRIELQKAYAQLDQFCHTVSHDIRSPLYVIRQLSELLEDELKENNPDEAMKICGMLNEKADQAASMTEGLHRFSTALYEDMNYSQVDMDWLAEDVFEELSMPESGRKIHFIKEVLPPIQGDRTLLRLVVQNILGNALKFTRLCETAEIKVSGEVGPEGNLYHFEDNGIGFDESLSEEVFQVFSQVHEPGNYEGDGIGLATVQRIVERHMGNVTISSTPGVGTCVNVFLPIGKKAD